MRAGPGWWAILLDCQIALGGLASDSYDVLLPNVAEPDRYRAPLGMLCTNRRAVCLGGLGRSAALSVLAMVAAIAELYALRPVPIRNTHLRDS